MMSNAKIATAMVGGYLLGRTKKGKLALSLGMMLAGRKLSLNPQELVRTVAGSPLLSGLSDQVRKDLVEGVKSAAGSALETRMNSLADSLHERSAELEGGDESGGSEDRDGEGDDEEEDAPGTDREDGEGTEEEPGAEEPEEPEEKPAPRTAKKKTAGTARKATGASSRPAKKTAKASRSRSAKAARGGGDE